MVGANVFAGGIADKLGNRYEAKWLVRQFLDVIGGKAQSIRFEGITPAFRGFECALERNATVEWHQAKVNSPNGNWTLARLNNEGVLTAFKARLDAADNNICVFVSQDPAKDIGTLAEKAKVAMEVDEFWGSLGGDHSANFAHLQRLWGVDQGVAFTWLQRCRFRTESEDSIESATSTIADVYFSNTQGRSFGVLREFLETRMNKVITTEFARRELRVEGKLALKDASLDPTVKERLLLETQAYLNTYIPFGAGGSTIARAEAAKLGEIALDPASSHVVLVTGVAGSGKSGVLREFVGMLADREIAHLALRIDQHLDCSSTRALGQTLLNRDESPVATLKGLSPERTGILIVDQVDAVSEVSGRNGAIKNVVLNLAEEARILGGILVVITCRTFDLENDARLKSMKSAQGVAHVDVQLLNWETEVQPFLKTNGFNPAELNGAQRGLLCLPLNLAMFLEVSDTAAHTFASRDDLFLRLIERKSRRVRVDRRTPWDVLAPLSKLADWMSERQRLDAPSEILADFVGALDILSSEGLIVRSRHQINFFHESFFDYVYARTFAARQMSVVSLLRETEQHLFRRTQVRQILEALRQTETVCQQSVNNGIESNPRKRQQTGVEEHKGTV